MVTIKSFLEFLNTVFSKEFCFMFIHSINFPFLYLKVYLKSLSLSSVKKSDFQVEYLNFPWTTSCLFVSVLNINSFFFQFFCCFKN